MSEYIKATDAISALLPFLSFEFISIFKSSIIYFNVSKFPNAAQATRGVTPFILGWFVFAPASDNTFKIFKSMKYYHNESTF